MNSTNFFPQPAKNKIPEIKKLKMQRKLDRARIFPCHTRIEGKNGHTAHTHNIPKGGKNG